MLPERFGFIEELGEGTGTDFGQSQEISLPSGEGISTHLIDVGNIKVWEL